MKRPEPKFEDASSAETDSRRREVRLLVNIAEPDPEYQPLIVTDEASLLDAVGTEPQEIARRFDAYFGTSLSLDLRSPIWRLVDTIRKLRPGWPDDPGPS
jgi:hypothetical protein